MTAEERAAAVDALRLAEEVVSLRFQSLLDPAARKATLGVVKLVAKEAIDVFRYLPVERDELKDALLWHWSSRGARGGGCLDCSIGPKMGGPCERCRMLWAMNDTAADRVRKLLEVADG